MREILLNYVRIQANGCGAHDVSLQVKPSTQSKQKYDLFTQLTAMPTPEAFPPPGLFGCPLVPS